MFTNQLTIDSAVRGGLRLVFLSFLILALGGTCVSAQEDIFRGVFLAKGSLTYSAHDSKQNVAPDWQSPSNWTPARMARDRVAAVSPATTNTPTASPTATATPLCLPIVLYDQGHYGINGVNSQDFETTYDAFDDMAADDFVVPEGQTWTVQKVVVNGTYFNGAGPADSFNVSFYTDAAMFPGSAVVGGTFIGAGYTNASSVFTIMLPSDLMLNSGTYWVAVQARMDGIPGGQWGWKTRTATMNSPAVWRNQGGGFNIPACVEWARRGATCMIDPAAPDQAFKLVGTIGAIGACFTPTPTSTPTPNGTPCLRAGCLDQTFDFDGMISTEIEDATGQDVAIQPDGKIVVAGLANRGSNADMGVVRYNSNGSLDASFGTDGKVTTDFFGSLDYATAVVIQPDGKIVVAGTAYRGAGYSPTDFALARYNTNGSPDTDFDGDGKVTVSFVSSHEEASDLIIQPDGKIIVAGSASPQVSRVALARLNTNGSLDTSFDGDGRKLTNIAGSAQAVKLQPDNKIVIGGTDVAVANGDDFLLARFDTNGQLDTTFGSGGSMVTDMSGGNNDAGNDIAIQSDGKIVLVGSAGGATSNCAMLRSNTDGTLDTSFGVGGRVFTAFDGFPSTANSVVIQSDSKIVSAGRIGEFSSSNFALSRYNADGSLDSSFGSAGEVTTDFEGPQENALALAVQPEGKIVAVGFTAVDTDIYGFGVARYFATAPTPAVGAVSGTVTYGNAIGAPQPRAVSNVLLSGAGSVPVSVLSGFPNGTYSLSGFGSGAYTVTPTKTGGVNGAVTSFDAGRIAQHVAGINPLSGNQMVVADVSGNGTISSFDAGQIAKYVAGLTGFGSTANWIFTPANRNYASITGNISGEDFVALLMGDVSGNWTNTGAR